MTNTAHDIFTAIKDKELLAIIAEKRGIDPDENKKNLGKAIADEVHGHGLKKLLELLPEKHLEGFGISSKNDDDTRIKHQAMIKKIFTALQESGPANFLEKLDSTYLSNLFLVLDQDKPETTSSKKLAEALVDYADAIGVENTLSSLNVSQLQGIAKALKLAVDSSSVNVLIDCITSGEEHKKEKKKKAPKPSKTKPEIKKGIPKVDLQNHYWREDLVNYCKDNSLTVSGNKRELITRIVNHLDGKTKAPSKKRKAPPSKKEPAKKKAKTEKGATKKKEDKSEKSEKESTEKSKSDKE